MTHSYHYRPLLKAPVWTWEIPVYFFLGGIAGVAAVIAFVALVLHMPASLVRAGLSLAAAGAWVSPLLLVSDLGRPARFLYMLRVFKHRSAMSVGVWTLVVFSVAATLALGAAIARDAGMVAQVMGGIEIAAAGVSALAGLVLATYTGVLLGATAIPVWARRAHLLPLVFGISSLGAAASALELVGERHPSLNTIAVLAAGLKLLTAFIPAHRHADGSRARLTGRGAITIHAADACTGPLPLLLRLAFHGSTTVRLIAAATTLAGGLASRVGWVDAGRSSAADPGPALGERTR